MTNHRQHNHHDDTAKLPVDRDWLQKLVQRHHPTYEPSNEPIFVLAPMVDQSDLPFRLQCRKYRTHLCFTPMIHTRLFCQSPSYRKKFDLQHLPPQDRPLIAQICGSDPETALECCLALQNYCDGIDINCGCPQAIAKRGNYGAYLLEQPTQLLTLVRKLTQHLNVPLSVKVRLLPSGIDDSIQLYQQLVDAGVHMLTLHGRNRFQKKYATGAADWDAMKTVVQTLQTRIPVLVNGSVESYQQAMDCWHYTGADGVMSAEAILEYPPLFHPTLPTVPRIVLAHEYLDLATQYPPHIGGQGSYVKTVRVHLHRFLYRALQTHVDVRNAVIAEECVEGLRDAIAKLTSVNGDEGLTWYYRHRIGTPEESPLTSSGGGGTHPRQEQDKLVLQQELLEDTADCLTCLFDDDC